ncbi:uncharacterized protein RAG0_01641 [Rhynchosporium agropyri]|uniref:Uncharacterized protein n=1 Tax=Rhynchosporium agropyri TaxID=914238 RepID=A0A1E1JY25_9HELO|nr:uncharacterized protein RAG0_01641 [Rhynchosporium agropyri]
MGLPLFITPVEPEVAFKASEKIASQSRSSIRRHRTLRGPHARLTAEARRRRIHGLLPEAEQYVSYQDEVLEGQRANGPTLVEVPSLSSLQARSLRLERMRMRDPLSYERHRASNPEIDGPLMPPVPESRDYSEAEVLQRHREAQSLRLERDQLAREGESRDRSREIDAQIWASAWQQAEINANTDYAAMEEAQRHREAQISQLQGEQQAREARDHSLAREAQRHSEAQITQLERESRDRSLTGSEQRHREETLRREANNLRLIRADFRRLRRRHPAPTPPYFENDLPYVAPAARIDFPRLSSSLSPVLSPARQVSTAMVSSPRRRLEEADFNSTTRGPLTEGSATSRPLHSQTATHIMRLRQLNGQARLDGLGDRDRSLSPEGGAASWDTLLTSITPDPQHPSAGSSFASTSAAAAAASSSSGSGPSSGSVSASTSMTSPDRLAEHECDISDAGSNTDDEEEGLFDISQFAGTRGRGVSFWRTYADVVTARAERATEEPGLGEMRRILSRLAWTEENERLREEEAELNRTPSQERSRRDADGSY